MMESLEEMSKLYLYSKLNQEDLNYINRQQDRSSDSLLTKKSSGLERLTTEFSQN